MKFITFHICYRKSLSYKSVNEVQKECLKFYDAIYNDRLYLSSSNFSIYFKSHNIINIKILQMVYDEMKKHLSMK